MCLEKFNDLTLLKMSMSESSTTERLRSLTAQMASRDAELAEQTADAVRAIADEMRKEFEQRDAMRLLKIAKLERMIEERDTAALRWRVKDREQLDNEARVSAARAMLLRARAELHSSSVGIRAVSAALSRA